MDKHFYIKIISRILCSLLVFFCILTGVIYYLLPKVAESAVNSLLHDWTSENENMTISIDRIGFFQTTFSFSAILHNKDAVDRTVRIKYGILRYHAWELVTIKYIRSIELHHVQFPVRFRNGKLDIPLLNLLHAREKKKTSFDFDPSNLPFSFGRFIIDGKIITPTPLYAEPQHLSFACIYDSITGGGSSVKIQSYIRNQKNVIFLNGVWKPPFIIGNINAVLGQDQLFKELLPSLQGTSIQLKSKFTYNHARRELVNMSGDIQDLNIALTKELQFKCSPSLKLNTISLYNDLNSGRLSMECHGIKGSFYGYPFQLSTSFQWKWKQHDVNGLAKIRLFNEQNDSINLPFHINGETGQWLIDFQINPTMNDELKYQLDGVNYYFKNIQCSCRIKTSVPPSCEFDVNADRVRITDATMNTYCDQFRLKAKGTTEKLDMSLTAKNYYGSFSNGDTVITLPCARISSTYANEQLDFVLSSENGTCTIKPAGISARSVRGDIPFQIKNRTLRGRGTIMSTDTSVYGYLMDDTFADLQINGEKMDIQLSNNSLFYNRKMNSSLVYGSNGWENTNNTFSTSVISIKESADITKNYFLKKGNNIFHTDIRSLMSYDPERSFLLPEFMQDKIKWFFTPFQISGEMLDMTYTVPQKLYQSCLDFFTSQKQTKKK